MFLRKNGNLFVTFLIDAKVDIIKYVIDNMTDFDYQTKNKFTIVHYVCFVCSPCIIKYFVEKLVNTGNKFMLEYQNIIGKRPLHLLLHNPLVNLDIVKYFYENGVNFECESIKMKRPIHYLCSNIDIEIFKYFVEKGINIETPTVDNIKPIHYAARNIDNDIVKYLIDNITDINCKTKKGWRPIHIIYNYCSMDVYEYIRLKGAIISKMPEIYDSDIDENMHDDLINN